MPRLKRPSILAVLAAAAVLAGCGSSSSSSGVTPRAYVKSVCSAVVPFEKDVVTRSNALNSVKINDATQGKTALQGFLTAVSGDTKKVLVQLRSAGAPNVKNGPAISRAIIGAFEQLDTTMTHAVGQAAALPTNSPQSFKTGAQSLGNTVRSSMTNIGTNLQASTLKSPELQQAASKEPTCTSLNG